MTEELTQYNTALLAKEKGFDIPTRDAFVLGSVKGNVTVPTPRNWGECGVYGDEEYLNRPTQSLLQKWLREVYNIVVEVIVFNKGFLEKDKFCYQWRVYNNSEEWFTGLEYKTYELALEDCLLEALKLIK